MEIEPPARVWTRIHGSEMISELYLNIVAKGAGVLSSGSSTEI